MIVPIGIVVGVMAGIALAFWRAWAQGNEAGARLQGELAGQHERLKQALASEKIKAEAILAERRRAQEQEWRLWRERLAEEEGRLGRREEEIAATEEFLAGRERAQGEAQAEVHRFQRDLSALKALCSDVRAQTQKALLAKSGWTYSEAVGQYKERLASEVHLETERRWQKRLAELSERAEEEAQRLVEIVIQRIRPDYTEDHPHSNFTVDELGAAAKFLVAGSPFFDAFEQATGVHLEWREAEGVVVLSCPNGVKRELARRTLRKFAADRNPQVERLPALKVQAEQEADAEMRKTINWVLGRLRIGGVHPEIVKTLGRLKYRTSHAQNVLSHSYEVGFIGSMLSSEMGLNPKIGKRGSFMHDLGKALDAEKDAGHAVIGGDFAAQYGEDEIVVNAIAGHHEDVERKSLYPIVAQVADAISGGRPGARRETTERFLERVDQLMAIGAAIPGLSGYYAVHAGREFRVVVNPSQIKDDQMQSVCQQIAGEIEKNVAGPGVEIVVIRETKAVDYAR